MDFADWELEDFLDFAAVREFGGDCHAFGLQDEKHAAIGVEIACSHLSEILLIQYVKQVLRYLPDMTRSLQHAPIISEHL